MITFIKDKPVLFAISLWLAASSFGCGAGENPEPPTFSLATDEHGAHDGHEHGADDGHGHIAQSAALPGGEALDWCAEHSVPESVCTGCHPELIAVFQKANDWCAGHDLPESHCRLCSPTLTFPQEEVLRQRQTEATRSDITVSLYFRPNAEVCATDGALIQFASATTGERAGIAARTVYASPGESMIDAPAEVVFDETKTYVVATTVSALVSRWLVAPGDVVRKGEILAILQSPEIAVLKSSLVTARARYDVDARELERGTEMHRRGLINDAELDRTRAQAEQSRAELVSASGLLLAAGLSEEELDHLSRSEGISNLFALRANDDGLVAERTARLGELLEPGHPFALLADPGAMWVEARLTEEQLRSVAPGETLTFETDGRGGHRVGGVIIWVSRVLDPHTRTGTVRARVTDRNHGLQAHEFGRVRIVQTGNREVVLVPKDAVQWEGCCNVVFVKETNQRYRPRKVQVIDGEGPYYQVLAGLEAGEQVVVDGAFLLKTELKKSSIGAGCCGLDPVG